MCVYVFAREHTDFTIHRKEKEKKPLYILNTLGGPLFIKPKNHWLYAMMVIVKYANSPDGLTPDNKINI